MRLKAAFAALSTALTIGAVTVWPNGVAAQDITVMRIGTGATGGTYFPFGGLIANAISNPPGSRPCARGGNCGVPGLIAVAQATAGSGENIDSVSNGTMELALAQADVAYWAFHGTGAFQGEDPKTNLRAIASLFPENIHLIARADAGIESINDLRGKRVSLGAVGSGTAIDSRLILTAFGVRLAGIDVRSMNPDAATAALAGGELDAFFWVTGAPAVAVTDLAQLENIKLVPIDGPIAEKLAQVFPFFTVGSIPAGVYGDNPEVATLNVAALLVASSAMSDDMAFAITQALWHPSNRKLFTGGHPRGTLMEEVEAMTGIGFDIHPGAKRYYAMASQQVRGETPTEF